MKMCAKIPLYINNGKAYVWNAEDWYCLRSQHRICGALIGSLPSFPRQNDFLGLPMALTSEEAALMVEKDVCELYELPQLVRMPSEGDKKVVKALEQQSLKEQSEALKRKRAETLSQKIDIIIAGKRKKQLAKGLPDVEIDKEVLLQEEINKFPNLTLDNSLAQLPTEYFMTTEKSSVGINVLDPSVTDEDTGIVKYAIFKDLWERKYHITSGSKFGSDYLLYPGDPVKFHAAYMVRCVYDQYDLFNPTMFVEFGRLSVAVNKTAILAYTNVSNKIEYQTLQWHDNIH